MQAIWLLNCCRIGVSPSCFGLRSSNFKEEAGQFSNVICFSCGVADKLSENVGLAFDTRICVTVQFEARVRKPAKMQTSDALATNAGEKRQD